MKLGDKLTIAGIDFAVRPFTPAEHQAFDELADAHDLERKAARVKVLTSTRGGTAREAFLRADQKRLRTALAPFFTEDGDLRADLTEEERLEGYRLSTELDELSQQIAEVREDTSVEALVADEELTQAREAVTIAFIHSVLAPNMPLDEFTAALTPSELASLDEVVGLGKLRRGLSASTRREQAAFERTLAHAMKQPASGGNASESPQARQDAAPKTGTNARSRKSSSRSKAGNSERTKQPPRS